MNARRILIVDDSKTQQVLLQMSLEKDGFEIITAGDGLEGVSRAYMDRPDLVVSDIEMPELNGYQLCRLLKNDKKTANTPIILLSSLDQPQDLFWGIRAGADRYIVKSSDFSELKDAINLLLKNIAPNQSLKKSVTQVASKEMDWKSIRYSLNHLLDKLLFESTLSNEANRLADYIHNGQELMLEIALLISSLIDYSCLCICLFVNNRFRLYFDLRQPLPEAEITKIKEELITAENNKHHIQDPSKNTAKDAVDICYLKNTVALDTVVTDSICAKLTVPLSIHNECIGNLSLYSTKKEGLLPQSESIINMLAGDFSMVLKLMLLYNEIRDISITDGLTGLNNNRYFKEIFNKEFERAKRFKNNMSLIFIDIDHFKSINDNYGHLQGDSVLREIGAILSNCIRDIDFAARYGGEEFAILALETDIADAVLLAERIRESVESYSFKAEKKPLEVTISLGVATLTADVHNIDEMIKMSDDALYLAKENGRNRVYRAKQA